MLTPRNFVCVEKGITSPFIFMRLSLIAEVLCLVTKSIATVLFVPIRSLLELNHSVTFDRQTDIAVVNSVISPKLSVARFTSAL